MENYFILQMIALFLFSGIVIWISSNRLSVIVENIDDAFKLGDAFGGNNLTVNSNQLTRNYHCHSWCAK